MIVDPVARIRLRGQRGEFVAAVCVIEEGLCTVEGRWCRGWGAGNADERWSEPRSYSFPISEIRRVRWLAR